MSGQIPYVQRHGVVGLEPERQREGEHRQHDGEREHHHTARQPDHHRADRRVDVLGRPGTGAEPVDAPDAEHHQRHGRRDGHDLRDPGGHGRVPDDPLRRLDIVQGRGTAEYSRVVGDGDDEKDGGQHARGHGDEHLDLREAPPPLEERLPPHAGAVGDLPELKKPHSFLAKK